MPVEPNEPVQLRALKPEDVRKCWGYLRSNLERIRTKGPTDWIPEDIYSEIMAGRSVAFLFEIAGNITGAMVTTGRDDTLHIWVLWENSGRVADVMEATREMARKAGFVRGTFETQRRGWEKLAPKLGFRPYMWQVEV